MIGSDMDQWKIFKKQEKNQLGQMKCGDNNKIGRISFIIIHAIAPV